MSVLMEYKPTINVEGDDVDVILHGDYIEKSICNSFGDHDEYEGDCIEDMRVLIKTKKGFWENINFVIPDEALEKLSRKFRDAVHSGKAVCV